MIDRRSFIKSAGALSVAAATHSLWLGNAFAAEAEKPKKGGHLVVGVDPALTVWIMHSGSKLTCISSVLRCLTIWWKSTKTPDWPPRWLKPGPQPTAAKPGC
ncbi:hypothetical protein SRABI106_01721 [Rahnella aquatilis]|nr:hypothetical protein SRABI106_01721 [Rahnella aquatilis]